MDSFLLIRELVSLFDYKCCLLTSYLLQLLSLCQQNEISLEGSTGDPKYQYIIGQYRAKLIAGKFRRIVAGITDRLFADVQEALKHLYAQLQEGRLRIV